jgi:acyl-CoA hydrolase
MAAPEKLSEHRDLHLKIPIEQDDYLILLASLGKGGRSRTEIAVHILVRELQTLERGRYHERRVPRPRKEEG